MNPGLQKPRTERTSQASVNLYKKLARQSILIQKSVFNEQEFKLIKMPTFLEKEKKFNELVKNFVRRKCFLFLESK
jgi:hypothetical protein